MATKIQVRRDTTANWTTYGAEVPAAGEFCYDTDLKTLKIGDGVTAYRDLNVIADADFDATQINDNYVAVDGDNMTGDLTLGTDKITLDATDGSAAFDGTVIINNPASGEGTWLWSDGGVTATRINDSTKSCFAAQFNNQTTAFISADGSAEFAGDVQVGGDPAGAGNTGVDIRPTGAVLASALADNSVFSAYTTGTNDIKFEVLGDGSAKFAGGDISLNADGLGVFKQGIFVDDPGSDIGKNGAYLYSGTNTSQLSIYSNTNNSGSTLLDHPIVVSSAPDASSVKAIVFAMDASGTTKIGGTLPASPNISLNEDGSAEFAGDVNVSDIDATNGVRVTAAGADETTIG